MRIITIVLIWGITLWGGSGYDHGTAAGKGNLDIALTWNLLDYFENGQSYVVLGYGITDKIDIHGYYSSPVNNNDNYYAGLFYQFYESNRIDLATAVGLRKYINDDKQHIFVPQLLYTVKLGKGYEIGGSFVGLVEKEDYLGTTIDAAIYIPIIKQRENTLIKEVKLGVGIFRPILWTPDLGDWHPTYSLDIKI
jgi:hypothetical protein